MTTRSLPCSQKWETDRRLSRRRSSLRRKTTLTQRTKFHRPNQPPRVQRRKQASDDPAQQTTSSRLSQSPNVPRRKRASAICATRSRTLSQDTPRQQSPSLFFENPPAREPAQLVCNIGLGHTSDQTKTSKPVFTRSVPELNKTSSNLRSASRTLKTRWPPCFLTKTNADKPNGGSNRLSADPLSEATSPNQLPGIALLKAKMNEVSTLFNVFSNNENKERVAIYSVVCFTDSTQANSKRSQTKNLKRSHMRKANKNHYAKQPRTSNEKFIKNLSHKKLTDHKTALLAKGLKFIPTPPVTASHKSLLRDFQVFTRYMCLQYIFGDSAGKPHPFNVKSNWQPLPQPSVALESNLERTKF